MSDTIILAVDSEPIGIVDSPPAELRHEIQICGENGRLIADDDDEVTDETVTAKLEKDRPRYID
jgi:hypothetical protein